LFDLIFLLNRQLNGGVEPQLFGIANLMAGGSFRP